MLEIDRIIAYIMTPFEEPKKFVNQFGFFFTALYAHIYAYDLTYTDQVYVLDKE